MSATVQVPSSLNCGNVASAVTLTLGAGGVEARAARPCLPEGLTKFTCTKLTPDRSSVADKLTVTTAEPADVSMMVGVKLSTVRVGGVTSWIWAEEGKRDAQKKVTTNTSPTFDASCNFMGFS